LTVLDSTTAQPSFQKVLSCKTVLKVNKMCTHDHDTGLQAGVWDVDGTGMQNIDDPEVDLGIRKVTYQLVLPLCRMLGSTCLLQRILIFLHCTLERLLTCHLCSDLAEGHQLCLHWSCGYTICDGALHLVALLNYQRELLQENELIKRSHRRAVT
jgi:hypothetical protein